jgi:IclR family mhp operon transcriptional activator
MTYRPVRALTRGLAVLGALASETRATSVDLSEATGIHRTTVKRLLETLCEQGYVRLSPSDGTYRLARRALSLCAAPLPNVTLSEVSVPILTELVHEIRWPSELAVPSGHEMLVHESTHRQSPIAVEASTVGRRYPMLSSALGLAYVAFTDNETRGALVRHIGGDGIRVGGMIETTIERTRQQGYAECVNSPCSKLASIAMPVRFTGQVAACVSISYFKSAVPSAMAAERYVPQLMAAVEKIEMSARNQIAPPGIRMMPAAIMALPR